MDLKSGCPGWPIIREEKEKLQAIEDAINAKRRYTEADEDGEEEEEEEEEEEDFGEALNEYKKKQKNLQTQYTIAMYWAIQVTTGIGRDIIPRTNGEVAFTAVVTVLGMLL